MVDFICFDAYSFDQSHMDPKTISKIMFKSNLIWVNLIVNKNAFGSFIVTWLEFELKSTTHQSELKLYRISINPSFLSRWRGKGTYFDQQ